MLAAPFRSQIDLFSSDSDSELREMLFAYLLRIGWTGMDDEFRFRLLAYWDGVGLLL